MTAKELRKKYIEFFVEKGHKEIPSGRLVPEHDPTALFINSGMHPLVPYLLGQPHPLGTRLTSVQKCVRTDDINEVGDETHLTFFEMLGNWSLGDYFKIEAISWSFEFLTDRKWLGLDPQRIYVTVFEGNDLVPRDHESIGIWHEVFRKVGIDAKVGERIFAYPATKTGGGRLVLQDHAGRTAKCFMIPVNLITLSLAKNATPTATAENLLRFGTTFLCSLTKKPMGPLNLFPKKTLIPVWVWKEKP